MRALKSITLLLAAVGTLGMASCQGELDSDISLLFDNYSSSISASSVPSSNNSTASQQQSGGQQSGGNQNTERKLIGKWQLVSQALPYDNNYVVWPDKNGNSPDEKYYIEFFENGTYNTGYYRLFEAETNGGNWYFVSNNMIVLQDEYYKVLQASSTTLKLGWWVNDNPQGEYYVIEVSTFRKVN